MMEKEAYNWWTDPKNKEEVYRHSWWAHPENKTTFALPISVIKEGEMWVATTNKETEMYLGDRLHGCAQGETYKEAITHMFEIIRMSHEYSEECRLNYQRWVPFRKGDWKHTGGRWFVVFGHQIYFRYGTGMQGGWYIPFTKLNISYSSEWTGYKKWKEKSIKKK